MYKKIQFRPTVLGPLIHKIASSRIQTQDLTVCLCLNLKRGELDHSATTAGSEQCLYGHLIV